MIYSHFFVDDNITHFAIPIYFFRASLTSAVSHVTMAYVQWIPFLLDEQNRTTFIGRISVANWNRWPTSQTKYNPFIATTNLQPSRYAMAFDPPSSTAVFVDIAFIALDAENLNETNNDKFTTDFGDNKFPYFKGRASHLQQQTLEEDDADEDDNDGTNQQQATNENAQQIYDTLQNLLPTSVLKFLLDPNPLRFIDATLPSCIDD